VTKPLWEPSVERVENANVTAFARGLGEEWGVSLESFDALWRFSVAEKEKFWRKVWRDCGVIAETQGDVAIADADKLPGARFFPEARLNFAQNLLRRRDDETAIVFRGEDKVDRHLSYAELYDTVSRIADALRAAGVGPGDRVAGYLPNMPETIMAMLAAASLGAVWSSCSPDFGIQGVLDRFGQIEPKVLFGVEGYHYNGKAHDCLGKLSEIAVALPSLRHVVIVPYTIENPDIGGVVKAVMLEDFLAGHAAGEIDFVQMPFNAPLYILYSSGTTGVPKCIVHGAGGILLKHLSELRLHADVKRDDRVFYFTTCGWMMWNWLVSALACEARVLLYDG
jgi:acetoacetyl-CoA synthetase